MTDIDPPSPGLVDSGPPGPLVVSRDPWLLDEVRRLAASAGATPCVLGAVPDARSRWSAAPLVLVGADTAAELASAGLPRRSDVHVLARAPVEAAVWRAAVGVGAAAVRTLPDERDAVRDVLGAGSDGPVDGVVVCVTGGCGGAGASVLAAALATTAARLGRSTLLVDGDPNGGGVDLVLGAEDLAGLRWADLAATTGRVSAASLRGVLPVVDEVAVLSWSRDDPVPLAAGAAREVLAAGRRGHDLVVVDVARRPDGLGAEALASATRSFVVLPARVRAVAATRARLPALRRATAELGLVLRDSGGLDPDDVARSLGLALLATVRSERGLADWLDEGLGPVRRIRGSLARTCVRLVETLERPGDSRAA